MNKRAIPKPCETCGREKDDGRRECNACRIRRYRQDPEKLARDRERTALWKLEHRLAQLQATPPAIRGSRHADSQPTPERHMGARGAAGEVAPRSSHERTASHV